jgi:multidrug resistance efflux pump
MTETTSTETTLFTRLLTLDEAVAEAHTASLDAWKAQSLTTAEEGYTVEQAQAAIDQAKAADAEYRRLSNLREIRFNSFVMFDSPSDLIEDETDWFTEPTYRELQY